VRDAAVHSSGTKPAGPSDRSLKGGGSVVNRNDSISGVNLTGQERRDLDDYL
jgi:hypothetical protein